MSAAPAPHAAEPARGVGPGAASLGRTVLRGAGIILVVTLAARVAGFVRYLVFGASVGAGDVGTAYSTANLLPNVLFEVVAGGALAAVVVPLVAGLVPERDRPATAEGDAVSAERADGARRADAIISALLGWALLLTVPVAVVVSLLATPIAGYLLAADGTGASGVALGARLLRIFSVQLPLYAVAVVLGAYLQARRRFFWPAMMPLISSLVVMGAYRVYALLVPAVATSTTISSGAAAWLGWGTTAGVAAMAVPVAVAARRSGLRLRPTLRMPEGTGRRALRLGAAGLGAVGAQQAVIALVMVLAMRAGGTGTLPVFQYAQALYLLPFAILVVPLVTAGFPQLSELRLVGDTIGFARATTAGLRSVIAASVLGAAALIAAAPALEQFFRLVDRAGAGGVGSATAALALGLPGFAVATQCTRVLSAALRARDALLVGSAGWVVAALLIVILVLPSPGRTSAMAATAFGLAIAGGMALSALVGMGRVSDLVAPGGQIPQLRRMAIVAPLAMVVASVPGLLVAKALVTASTGTLGAVASGVLAALVSALVAAPLLALGDPLLARSVMRRLRRRGDGARESGTSATGAGPGERTDEDTSA